MAITPLPTPPQRNDPTNFASRADEFLAALPTFATQANALADDVNQDAGNAGQAATTATQKAAEAVNSASAAANSAASALSSRNEAEEMVERYQGSLASDPTLNKDGGALAAGDWYINTTNSTIRAYDGANWQQSLGPNTVYEDFASIDPGKGAALVGFKQAGAGAVARTVEDKAREWVSVKDFGAVGDGVTDDTAAFSAAAKAAKAGNPQELQRPDIPFGDWATVQVPSGTYLLASLVDTGNREIVWDSAVDAVILNPQNINGRLWREGSKTTDFHHGILDSAVSFSVTANRDSDELAQVSGFTNPNQLSKGNGRDSVACYFSGRVPPAMYGDTAVNSYSALGAVLSTPLTTGQVQTLRRGMIVQTRHSPQPYAGMLDSWASDGTSITVKDGWFLVDGSTTGTPATPTGTDGLDINIFRKAWAVNGNVFIDSASYGNAINTVEYGLRNNKGEPTSRGGDVEANGVYSVALDSGSSFYGDASFMTGGKWTYGFLARSGLTHAFFYDGSLGNLTSEPFESLIYGRNASGVPFFQVKADGAVELGLRGSGTPTPAVIDFHSGAANADYDARISCSDGNGATGQGTLDFNAKLIRAIGNVVTGSGPSTQTSGGIALIEAQSESQPVLFTARNGLNDATPPIFHFVKDRTGSAVQDGDGLGELRFEGLHTGYRRGGSISVNVSGTPSSTSMPGQMQLRVTKATSIIPTTALTIQSDHHIAAGADNVQTLGAASLRWSVVYAGTGTINTSDEREKQDVEDLSAAELRVAAALKGLVKKFRFKDAVHAKGTAARVHVGVIAQEVIAAFNAEGLDATRYGIICYDEWDETPAQFDEEGNVVQAARPAGNRYGIRYEELLAFIISAL